MGEVPRLSASVLHDRVKSHIRSSNTDISPPNPSWPVLGLQIRILNTDLNSGNEHS